MQCRPKKIQITLVISSLPILEIQHRLRMMLENKYGRGYAVGGGSSGRVLVCEAAVQAWA